MSKRTKIIIGACFAGLFALVTIIAVLGACCRGCEKDFERDEEAGGC
jgi:hypothetical protein